MNGEVRAELLSSKQVLKKFARYLPMAIPAALMYALFFCAAAIYGLNQVTDRQTAARFGFAGGIALTLLGIYLYLRFLVNAFSQYRFSVERDRLGLHGMAGWRFVRQEFDVDEVRSVSIGAELNALEEFFVGASNVMRESRGLFQAVQDVKANRLQVVDGAGKTHFIDFATYAFDMDSLTAVLRHLAERGVPISHSA